ncbi:RE1-silencing transcription factor B isoform X2 [Eurytemora carolleeae]|uniref:RE1-silencing transcription factor B isoform X2 n=1 Tax=Eurytemora carolleeae TaxID=1294199 RepID=UPI000C786522|nr:RE1-silencing transcription factor B isoform X2 [Eurytemora carolleeae]|eukprot:XP_023328963.1 RE1-silencing transcription factor B-like isoform X2 [Eurytemora affinis]
MRGIKLFRKQSLLQELKSISRTSHYLNTSITCKDGDVRVNILIISLIYPQLFKLDIEDPGNIYLIIPDIYASDLLAKYNEVFNQEFSFEKDDSESAKPQEMEELHRNEKDEFELDDEEFVDNLMDVNVLELYSVDGEKEDSQVKEKHKCDVCEFKTNLKRDLTIHRQTMHADSKYQCDVCEYSTLSERGMRRHQHSHNGYRIMCDQCEYLAADLNTLNNHINSLHEGSQYHCEQCSFTAKWERSVARHRETVHGDRKNSFLCDQCDYKTSQHASLKRHIKVMHDEGGIIKQNARFVDGAKFSCDLCSFKAKWIRSVRRHKQAVHEGSKIFPCDRCEYKSTQSGTLKRHIKLVHQKDPKPAEQYENRFSSFSSIISSTKQDP